MHATYLILDILLFAFLGELAQSGPELLVEVVHVRLNGAALEERTNPEKLGKPQKDIEQEH